MGSAERDVHRAAEGHQFHGNQALVVIAGDDGVELAAHGAHEDRVRRKRTAHVDAARARLRDRRREESQIFEAHQAVLARVGIESRDAEPRRREAE